MEANEKVHNNKVKRDTEMNFEVHIHEHLTPLRDRITRTETRLDYHENEFKNIRGLVKDLRDDVSNKVSSISTMLHGHITDENHRYDKLFQMISENQKGLSQIRARLLAGGVFIGLVTAAIQIAAALRLF